MATAPPIHANIAAVLDGDASGAVFLAENLSVLDEVPDESVDLIYIDPPFNTGKRQVLRRIETTRDAEGDRTGFQGIRYRTNAIGSISYQDAHDDYLSFLTPRLEAARRVLKASGSLYFHIDYRESHYCKVLLDTIFGRENFVNEIIWAYDYGARSTKRWPTKHDNILLYAKNLPSLYFDINAVERIPYMAPGLVGPEKAARGKTPTDTWWHSIVPTNGRERTGYPNQKPLGVVSRAVLASCPPGGVVLDYFAGSGTTGEAAHGNNRRFILVDNNAAALEIMARRFTGFQGIRYCIDQSISGDKK